MANWLELWNKLTFKDSDVLDLNGSRITDSLI